MTIWYASLPIVQTCLVLLGIFHNVRFPHHRVILLLSLSISFLLFTSFSHPFRGAHCTHSRHRRPAFSSFSVKILPIPFMVVPFSGAFKTILLRTYGILLCDVAAIFLFVLVCCCRRCCCRCFSTFGIASLCFVMEIFHFSSTKLHRDPISNTILMVILFYGALDRGKLTLTNVPMWWMVLVFNFVEPMVSCW